ncbi:MAG: hypothetical protein AB7O43_17905 [Hyphomicrobiaceae bacterium]
MQPAMRVFRWLMVIALIICTVPMLSVIVAGTIASANGCTLHEGFENPCVVMGRDIGNTLYSMGVMGWLMLATLPIAAGLIVLWVVVEIVRLVLVRRKSPTA